jgi:transcriptional regulator with XRE-family HTH domain
MSAQTGSGIGVAIKREMDRLGWTGADVQRHARVDPTSLSMFKLGRRTPRIPVLQRLADAFGVDLVTLLGSTDSAPRPRSESCGTKRRARKTNNRVLKARSAPKSPAIARRSGATR